MPTERLYYYDSDVRRFRSRVTGVREHAGRPAVVLERTAFYPTSGGQPYDTGLLGQSAVVEVVDAEAEVLHLVDGLAPTVGSDVEGEIDWPRRVDHMQQHSGQHVLSQAFERNGNLKTVGFHLGDEYCTIDLDTPNLERSTVERAELLANDIVFDDRPVTIHFAKSDDLARFGLRKPTERTGDVRIIEIGQFDFSACGGTHVKRTVQIGPIKVRRWERRGATSRVEFVCGWRALRDYQLKHEIVRDVAAKLRVGDDGVVDAVNRLADDLAAARESEQRLKKQMIQYEAADLAATAASCATSDGKEFVAIHRTFENRALDELKHLALTTIGASSKPVVVLLGAASGPGDKSALVFAQTPGLPFDLNALLREALPAIGGRGGGTRDLAQGGGPASENIGPVVEHTVEVLG